MYVCNCNGLTERQVKAAIDAGAETWMEVHLFHGVRPQCGKCGMEICDRLKRAQAAAHAPEPVAEPLPGLPVLAAAS